VSLYATKRPVDTFCMQNTLWGWVGIGGRPLGYTVHYFVFFGLFRNRSVCFGCFDIGPKHRNEPKQTEKIIYWFRETNQKTTKNRLSFGLFRFEPKIYFICFEDTLLAHTVSVS
jgi:hypothetical protein